MIPGFVDGSTVRIVLWHLRAAPAPLHFTIIGMKVATLSLPSLAVTSITSLPFPALPGVFYGATATMEGSTVYAYGRHERDGYVARAPVAQFTTASAWEFWGNAGSGGPDAWVSDPSRAIPMTFSRMAPIDPAFGSGSGPGSPLAVVRDGTRYLASAMLLDAFADEVSVFSATTPAGPWTYHGSMHTTPSPGISSYGALLRFDLPGVAGPTVIYSTNDFLFDTFEAPPSIPLYGPRFTAPDPGSIPP